MSQPVSEAVLRELWRQDGAQARASNTYLRRHELRAQQAAEACFDDYRAGYVAAVDRYGVERAIQRYEKAHHGETVDLRSFRLGFERARLQADTVTSAGA